MQAKRRAIIAAVLVAGAGLLLLAGSLGGQNAAGQPAPTIPIGSTVYVPFGLTLPPGGSITVPKNGATPSPTPNPAPPTQTGQPFPHGSLPPYTPLDVLIKNDAGTQITVLGDGNNVTVTAYDGSIVQLRTSYPPSAQGGALRALNSCGPDSAQGNVVRCRGLSAFINGNVAPGAPPLTLSVTTAPQGTAEQNLDLAPGDTAFLVWPQTDATSGPGPAIAISSTADTTAAIAWDGATFSATLPEGEAIAGNIQPRQRADQGGAFDQSGCTNEAGPNSVSCPISGLPQANITLSALPLAPSQPLSLAYSDRNGAGTLLLTPSGPDPAPGGETVTAALDTSSASLSGSGSWRPEPYALGDLELLLTLSDGTGTTYYIEGSVARQSGALLARGEIVNADAPIDVASWSAGDANAAAKLPAGGDVGFIVTSQDRQPNGLAVPAPPVPALLDGQLQGAAAPPVLGVAGQPLSFLVIGTMPLVSGQPTYSVDFGDGSPTVESQSQTITHTYADPGVYTLFASMIDGAGSRRFGVAQLATGLSPGRQTVWRWETRACNVGDG